jgi:hypothetical protein
MILNPETLCGLLVLSRVRENGALAILDLAFTFPGEWDVCENDALVLPK